jgi:competence protein ComEC
VARWPHPLDPLARRGDNAAGLVLELAVGPTRALLMADVDSVVENALDEVRPVALLKVGHHGSASSSGMAFLARAHPARAIVSVGERNVYGHPAASALARLRDAGAEILHTDREGALWFELRDDGVRRVDWRATDPADPDAGAVPVAAWNGRVAPRP